MKLFSFVNQSHLFNSRQIDRQTYISALIIFKLLHFGKNDSWKMEVLNIFGLWDQEIDLWFTNHEPLIPTLTIEPGTPGLGIHFPNH